MANKKVIHVTQNPDGTWSGTREGGKRASVTADTQGEAQKASKEIARREKGAVITHGRDGKIRESETYGKDPNPPKDKEH